jgi:hypothetical protein
MVYGPPGTDGAAEAVKTGALQSDAKLPLK